MIFTHRTFGRFFLVFILLFLVFAPTLSVHAHEVYVLSDSVITSATQSPGISLWDVLIENLDRFVFWAFIGILVIGIVFFFSISRSVERALDPFLAKLPPYAPVISRSTVGLSLIAAAYYQALFGPELPLTQTFSIYAPLVTGLLVVLGVMITFGFYTRIAAVSSLVLFAIAVAVHGSYMLTYANYAGELSLLLILGAHRLAFHHKGHDVLRIPRVLMHVKEFLTPYAFPILRIAFGTSLIYASLYAKVVHNQLALAVASMPLAGHTTSLASVFGFTPEFLVLGAAIIEVLIGLFFIIGIEIRFTALFLIFWLSLSLWYFGEVVWPHIILIGIPIAFIFYGYDKYSLEGFFFKRDGRDPVL